MVRVQDTKCTRATVRARDMERRGHPDARRCETCWTKHPRQGMIKTGINPSIK
jgi:hypothetical protein